MLNRFHWAAGALALATLPAQAVAPALDPQPYEQVVPVQAEADEAPIGTGAVKFNVSGWLKLEALFSIFSDGRVPPSDQGRDFYRPAAIPVATSATEDPRSMLDFHAKDSRLALKADTEVLGHALAGLLELDFRSAVGGASEAVTNNFSPRIRRGFITYDEWTLGQDWTTFRSQDALPEGVDDENGATQSLVIVRQPLVRYTAGALQVSLENSETSVLPDVAGGSTATIVTGDSKVPDLSARYDLKTGFGTFGAAVLARELRADRAPTGGTAPFDVADGTAFGWGASLAGKVPVFAGADARFAATYGDGIGRYLGLGIAPDAVAGADGSLETVKVAAAYLSYHQPWNSQWRSNLTLGTLQVNNDTNLTGTSVTKSVDSGQVNLFWQPATQLQFGIEYLHAIRKLENGDDGTLDRAQFAAKYSF